MKKQDELTEEKFHHNHQYNLGYRDFSLRIHELEAINNSIELRLLRDDLLEELQDTPELKDTLVKLNTYFSKILKKPKKINQTIRKRYEEGKL